MAQTTTTEEYIDALTEDGEMIGPLPRSQLHREGIWHRVIHLWIVNSRGDLVIQKRAACKESFPSLWDISVAGHMSAGDSPKVACQREAEEELGIHLTQEELVHVFSTKHQFTHHNGAYKDNEFVEVFILARELELSQVVLQAEEVEEVKWMHWRDVKRGLEDPNGGFVTAHTHYEPFWAYLEKHYPTSEQAVH